jgi:uridine kinase
MPDSATPRSEVIGQIARYVAAVERPHPVRVGIDGISAAGKTTLADELVEPLEQLGRTVIRAQIDDFHRPMAERYQLGRLSPEGYYLYSFDYPAIRERLLLPLGPGGNRRYCPAVFDQPKDEPIDVPERQAMDDAILLADGIFLFRPELNDLWDIRIFVDADRQVATRRAIQRDLARGGTVASREEVYRERYNPGEQYYLATIDPRRRADLIVENTDPTRPWLAVPGQAGPERSSSGT